MHNLMIKENQIWRIKTKEELDKLIKHKNIVNHSINKPTHAHLFFLFIKIYLKFLKTLLHVSVIRLSSGSL